MEMLISEVHEDGVTVVLDEEAHESLRKLADENLGVDASQSEKEMYINSLLIQALTLAVEDIENDQED